MGACGRVGSWHLFPLALRTRQQVVTIGVAAIATAARAFGFGVIVLVVGAFIAPVAAVVARGGHGVLLARMASATAMQPSSNVFGFS